MTRLFLTILGTALCLASGAQAFCGLYVARADGKLFNEASKVIYTRDGEASSITMASDFQGEVAEFAMIVPTPGVLRRDQIRTVQAATMDHLDAYSAARLVEYNDGNPCWRNLVFEAPVEEDVMADEGPTRPQRGAAALGVTVEAEYAVGEFDIVMLSAEQSDGLETWLIQEGYKIPEGASAALGRYLEMGMKFFVAKVNLARRAAGETANLSPLQINFTSPDFMLPLQLGMVNSKGRQDLILMTLTQGGRVETANYPVTKIPSDFRVPVFIRADFPRFYNDLFDSTMERMGGTGVMLEYGWDMGWCDPCAADPLSFEALEELGVTWLPDDEGASPEVYVTRLHIRYDAASFTEDLMLEITGESDNFQGRYVMRNPWPEPFECDARDYVKQVRDGVEEAARNLRDFVDWPRNEIRRRSLEALPAQYK